MCSQDCGPQLQVVKSPDSVPRPWLGRGVVVTTSEMAGPGKGRNDQCNEDTAGSLHAAFSMKQTQNGARQLCVPEVAFLPE